jgi:drug/metabolite transporter (DMT)-like permease
MAVSIRMAGDLPVMQKSFFRNIVSLLVAAIVLRKSGVSLGMPVIRKSIPLLLMRSAFGTVGMLCNFYAVDHLVLGDATMLNKLSPFFAVLLSAWFLKERVRPAQLACILGAFAGSLFIVKPTFSNLLLVPSLIGFVGGLGAGSAYAVVRSLGNRDVPGVVIVFAFSLFSTLVTFPSTLVSFHPMQWSQLCWLLATGLFAALGQFSITAAYRAAPPNRISVYDYSQVIFSAFFGYLFFSQVPDLLSLVGYLAVIGMGVVMFFLNRKDRLRAGPSSDGIL